MFITLIGSGATPVLAEEERATDEAIEKMDTELSGEGAAASNALAAVNNTDLKYTYIQLDDSENSRRVDYWIKGGWTFASWGKLSYVLTYQETNETGSSESDWESLSLKPIVLSNPGSWVPGNIVLQPALNGFWTSTIVTKELVRAQIRLPRYSV